MYDEHWWRLNFRRLLLNFKKTLKELVLLKVFFCASLRPVNTIR